MFSVFVCGILLFAFTGIGLCQESVTADFELIIGDDTTTLREGETTTSIDAFDDFTKVPGVREDATALLVETGKHGIFKRIREEDGCLWELKTTSCPGQQITYTFWLNVQAWTDGSSTIFRAATTSEPGFRVLTSRADDKLMEIFYNGNGIDYVVTVPKTSVTLQWTFLAAVIDGTTQNMKVYLNDTVYESNGETRTRIQRTSEKPMSLGLTSEIATLHFAGLKIYYTALDQTTLQNIYQGVLNGGTITTTTTNAATSTTEGSTTNAPTVTTTTETPATTMETVTTASTHTTTTPPTEPSSTSSPVSCQTINAEWEETFADWEKLRDEYSKAFEEWKENSCGCM